MKRLLFLASLLTLFSCHGHIDYSDPTNVPEGVLRIFADKKEIAADGQEKVTFTVKFGSKDVSTDPGMNIISVLAGEETTMKPGLNTFSTTVPSEYSFKARYYSGEAYYTDNEVKVSAESVAESVGQKDYYRRVWGMQFTAVSCTYCPELTASLRNVMAMYPDRMVLTSFHVKFNEDMLPDPMRLPINEEFRNEVKMSEGLPLFAFNMEKSPIVDQQDLIEEKLTGYLNQGPASCGVAISTSYDKSDRTLSIRGKVTSNLAESLRYHVILVEDGVEYTQAGVSGTYVHNSVVRDVLADNKWGDRLNSGVPVEVGVEVALDRTVKLAQDWNPDNMRVVLAVLVPSGEGYVCGNINECALGSSVDYIYEKADEPRQFVKNVCLIELTDASCTFCPDATRYIDRNILKKMDNVRLMAFHEKDEWAFPGFQTFYDRFSLSSTPSAIVDMRVGLSLESGARDRVKDKINESLNNYPAHCGISVSSSCSQEGTSARINVEILSEKTDGYYLAAYIVEDGIIGEQRDGDILYDDYYHQCVVRKMISSSIDGDSLGEIQSGKSAAKDYSISVDSSWNLGKTYVYVLVLDQNGFVNNMQVCLLDGGSAAYEYIE